MVLIALRWWSHLYKLIERRSSTTYIFMERRSLARTLWHEIKVKVELLSTVVDHGCSFVRQWQWISWGVMYSPKGSYSYHFVKRHSKTKSAGGIPVPDFPSCVHTSVLLPSYVASKAGIIDTDSGWYVSILCAIFLELAQKLVGVSFGSYHWETWFWQHRLGKQLCNYSFIRDFFSSLATIESVSRI